MTRSRQLPLPLSTPQTVDRLLERARALTGWRVGNLAEQLDVTLHADPLRSKGKVGELVERALGACAGNLDLPDFPGLGVELKTIPMTTAGRVRESTFVCTLDLDAVEEEEWEDSRLWRKLRCVLWMPVEASSTGPLPQRRLGQPLLWRPSDAEVALLRADWEELTGCIAVGGIEEISAHRGQVLQARPKAAHGAVRVTAYGPDREPVPVVPLGFYLRSRFTEDVLWRLAARTPTGQPAF